MSIEFRLSHTQRSFEIGGDAIMRVDEGLLARPFFGFSWDDGGTTNAYSFFTDMRIQGAPASASGNILNYTNNTMFKTQSPNTVAGGSGNFHEGDELHLYLMRNAVYRWNLLTPAANAPESDRVTIQFWLGA